VITVLDEQTELWEQRLADLHERAVGHLAEGTFIPSSILDAIDKLERQLGALESVRLRTSATTPDDERSTDGSDE